METLQSLHAQVLFTWSLFIGRVCKSLLVSQAAEFSRNLLELETVQGQLAAQVGFRIPQMCQEMFYKSVDTLLSFVINCDPLTLGAEPIPVQLGNNLALLNATKDKYVMRAGCFFYLYPIVLSARRDVSPDNITFPDMFS